MPVESETPRDECGVFGIFDHTEAARLAYLGLYALQHRGQESCGIVSYDGRKTYKALGMGKVVDFFDETTLESLPGHMAVGHVRYSTTGSSTLLNAQPILVGCNKGLVATAHNGNIVNAHALRANLEDEGHIFQTTSDSEVISHLIAKSRKADFVEAVVDAVSRLQGAFSLLILREGRLIALRDPHGFRPLALGRLGASWLVASETSAIDMVGGVYEREVEPGEMVVIDDGGLHSLRPFPATDPSQCVFEMIYFARPNSFVFGESVYLFRTLLGKLLAREQPVEADLVVPVPDSGTIAALGYAEESGLPFAMGLIRSHYIGRTFIEPTQRIRDFGVRIKFAPVRSQLAGKRVVLVDDSLVRGTTSRKLVKLVRDAGATEVHLRISAPPTRFPCFYGIDFPDPAELIANQMDVAETARSLGADSLAYITLSGLFSAMVREGSAERYCAACFNGCYPVAVVDEKLKKKFETGLPLFQDMPGNREP
jgi:amidophosphoribosyltransferase